MRIAYLIHQDVRGLYGGSEVYAASLAQAAAEAGHEVLVVARSHDISKPLEKVTENGIHHALLNADYLPDPQARFRLGETYDNPRALSLITDALDQFAADRLHVHHFLLTSARVVNWAVRRKIPVTATLHDYWAFCHRFIWQLPDGSPCPGPDGGLRCRRCGKPSYNRWPGVLLQPAHVAGFIHRNAVLKNAYRQMDAVFAPSLCVMQAHQRYGFSQANLVHLPYGLPATNRTQRAIGKAPFQVGFLGRIAPEKGLEILLEAMQLRQDITLHVFGVGADDYVLPLKEKYQSDRVLFHDPFPHGELDRVLSQIDVVAVPSQWRENLPLVVLEAAARGVPTLVADSGGLSETVELCGAVLISPNEPAAWAKALGDLHENPQRRQELREKTLYERRIEDDLAAHLAGGN